jgi:hypothetical protein
MRPVNHIRPHSHNRRRLNHARRQLSIRSTLRHRPKNPGSTIKPHQPNRLEHTPRHERHRTQLPNQQHSSFSHRHSSKPSINNCARTHSNPDSKTNNYGNTNSKTNNYNTNADSHTNTSTSLSLQLVEMVQLDSLKPKAENFLTLFYFFVN